MKPHLYMLASVLTIDRYTLLAVYRCIVKGGIPYSGTTGIIIRITSDFAENEKEFNSGVPELRGYFCRYISAACGNKLWHTMLQEFVPPPFSQNFTFFLQIFNKCLLLKGNFKNY